MANITNNSTESDLVQLAFQMLAQIVKTGYYFISIFRDETRAGICTHEITVVARAFKTFLCSTENIIGHKTCVPLFLHDFCSKLLCCDKYLAVTGGMGRRNACRSLCT
jgi:hypothetical protein